MVIFYKKLSISTIPLLNDVHSTCVTLTEKLLENEAPLDTAVRTTGELDARPMSTYTKETLKIKSKFNGKATHYLYFLL